MYIEFDYITYSVLEILAERSRKKFYPQEILDDLLENKNICHDIFDFNLNAVSLGLNAIKTYRVFNYEPVDEDIICKCKKLKKDAYKISYNGMSIIRAYQAAREFFVSGFKSAMTHGKEKMDDDSINALAGKAWCCHVTDEFAKIMERVEEENRSQKTLDELLEENTDYD